MGRLLRRGALEFPPAPAAEQVHRCRSMSELFGDRVGRGARSDECKPTARVSIVKGTEGSAMKKLSLVSGVAATFALGACREERPPEPPMAESEQFEDEEEWEREQAVSEEEQPEAMEEAEPEATSFLIEVDSEIVRRCEGLDADRMVFHRDSMRADSEHRESLQKLAQCVGTGDLADERIAIIGFADPRGRHDYDFERGGERAQSVAQYLGTEGVPRDRMATMSMGEVFAMPEDRETFEFERRVTIRLADEEPGEMRPSPPTATGRG